MPSPSKSPLAIASGLEAPAIDFTALEVTEPSRKAPRGWASRSQIFGPVGCAGASAAWAGTETRAIAVMPKATVLNIARMRAPGRCATRFPTSMRLHAIFRLAPAGGGPEHFNGEPR